MDNSHFTHQDKLKSEFEKLYGRTLSNQEAFVIRKNFIGFFETLIKMAEQNKKPNENYRSTN